MQVGDGVMEGSVERRREIEEGRQKCCCSLSVGSNSEGWSIALLSERTSVVMLEKAGPFERATCRWSR